jgi:hypothetical protein
MTALSPGTHTYRDNIIVVEHSCTYVYCATCGGLKFPHLVNAENPNQVVQITALWPACTCQVVEVHTKEVIAQLIEHIYHASGNCKSVEDVRALLLRVASREEMK